MFKLKICPRLILTLLPIFIGSNAFALFSKTQAVEQLKKTGIRWRMTDSLIDDARAKEELATSSFSPKLGLAFKEYYAKINPVQFGGPSDLEALNQVAFGTTALEMSWTVMDPFAKADQLLARNNLRTSNEKKSQYQSELMALMFLQYLNVQRLERQIDLMNSNLVKSELILKLAKAKKNVGAGIALDIARAKSLFELDRIKKIVVLNKLQKAKHELSATLGLEKMNETLEPLQPRIIKIKNIQSYLEKSYAKRADLKVAHSDLEAAHAAFAYSEGFFFPKFSLIGEVGSTQASLLGLPMKSVNGFVGASLTIPLDSGGLIASKKAEAWSAQNKASMQFEQTKIEILQQVKEALEQLLSAEEALNASENYITTAKEEFRIAERRYREGVSNVLDYTTTNTSQSSAEDTLTESIFNYEVAKLNYYRVQGSMDEYTRSLTESVETNE